MFTVIFKKISKRCRILKMQTMSMLKYMYDLILSDLTTPNNELKIMYEDIREQIKIRKEKQQILILGDFNAKVGVAIEGNKTQVTKGGRQLLKLANKENMIILNTVKEKHKGVWTSVLGEKSL